MASRFFPTRLRSRSSRMMPALATRTHRSTASTDSTTKLTLKAHLSLPKKRCTWSPVDGKNLGGSMLSLTPRSTTFLQIRIALIRMACPPTRNRKCRPTPTASGICMKEGLRKPANSGPPPTKMLSPSKLFATHNLGPNLLPR